MRASPPLPLFSPCGEEDKGKRDPHALGHFPSFFMTVFCSPLFFSSPKDLLLFMASLSCCSLVLPLPPFGPNRGNRGLVSSPFFFLLTEVTRKSGAFFFSPEITFLSFEEKSTTVFFLPPFPPSFLARHEEALRPVSPQFFEMLETLFLFFWTRGESSCCFPFLRGRGVPHFFLYQPADRASKRLFSLSPRFGEVASHLGIPPPFFFFPYTVEIYGFNAGAGFIFFFS